MFARILLCLATLSVLLPVQAAAHKPSDSYLTLSVNETTVEGRWDIALRDLDYAIGLDGDGDGAITWGELRARHEAIAAYALPRLDISTSARACPIRIDDHLVENHSDGAYAVLRFSAPCPVDGNTLRVTYRLFFDLDSQHRGLLRVDTTRGTHTAVLSPEKNSFRSDLNSVDPWRQFLDYGREGIWHIWIGFDHVLFLLTLLLPAVLYRVDGGWRAVREFREGFWRVFKLVTAFTLAHSITLILAALGVISIPSRLVESAIAASVLVAALNNIYPIVTRRLWAVAFAFGLVHGLGFASVLKGLELPHDSLLTALVSFNLGVEAGQLGIIALLLPVTFMIRRWRLYPRLALTFGSTAIGALASIWLFERALNLEPLLW